MSGNRHNTLSRIALWQYAGIPVALAAGTFIQIAQASEEASLPLQAATVSASAAPADNTAALISTLEQQIKAQQALLQALQQRVAQPQPTSGGASPQPVPTSPAGGGAGVTTVEKPAGSGEPATDSSATDGVVRPETPPVAPATSAPAIPSPPQSAGVANMQAGAEVAGTAVTGAPPVQTPAPEPAVGAAGTLPLTTDAQRQAYASGVSVWRDIENSMAAQRSLGIGLDPQYVMEGVRDMYERSPLKLSPDAIDSIMTSLNARYTDRIKEVRVSQEAEGKSYRISFSKQKGAFSDAGAWYLIESKGTGRRLRTTDMAVLTVTGTLPDGTVFDASGQNGQSKTVKVGALMPSVAIGLQKVGVGGRLKIVVPPAKGYGDAGLPPAVPGGATLIFDIVVKGVESGGN